MSEKSATLASVSCKPGASMMQQITVVTSRRMAYLINWNQVITCTMYTKLCVLLLIAYMILLAMEELHMLGQHWQIAQAAEPKQLKRKKLKICWQVFISDLISNVQESIPGCSAAQGDDGPHCWPLYKFTFSSNLKFSWSVGSTYQVWLWPDTNIRFDKSLAPPMKKSWIFDNCSDRQTFRPLFKSQKVPTTRS